MTCRRAFEIDLAEFVAGRSAPAWADFRDHYPRCPDCSAEVRAWTEVDHALRSTSTNSGHPAAERLVRYEERRGTLAPAEREEIERHLAGCPSCRDELAALRRFDFRPLEPTPLPMDTGGLLAWLRRLVTSPVFAYAVVLLLLYPALGGRFTRKMSPPPAAPTAERPAAKSEAFRPLEVPEAILAGRAGAPAKAAPAPSPSPPVAAREGEPPVLALRSGTPAEAVVAPVGSGIVLRIVLGPGEVTGGAEVRVLDPDGRRELRERVPSGSRSLHVDVGLPPTWRTPGRYRVEVQGTGSPSAPARVLYFALRAPG